MERKFMKISEAARILGVCPATLRRAVKEKRIVGARRTPGGSVILIPVEAVLPSPDQATHPKDDVA